MSRILIDHADYVLTLDPSRRIIVDGAVVVQDDRIAVVGKSADIVLDSEEFDEVIDGRGKLVMPGLVDSHVHNAQQLGRGIGDEAYSGPERLFRRLWVLEDHMDEADTLCAARLAQCELIKAGVTLFADPGNYYPAKTAQAVGESGIRGIVARTMFDVFSTAMGNIPKRFEESTTECLERSEEFVAEFDGSFDGRLKAWFSMRVPIACSDDLLQRAADLAKRYKVGIIGHACENRDEVVASHLRYGMGDVARLHKLGVLGPNVLLLHVGWIDAVELGLLAENQVKISLSPGASFHQAMGNISHGRGPEMLERGIAVSLGSDSAVSGNFLDPIRQAYLLVGGYHEARLDPKVIRPEKAVEMLTLDGARTLLWEHETGSLEVGKKADITILDIMRAEWLPVHNPVANLVYCAHGGCVDSVICDGQVVLRNREILTLDEDAIRAEAIDRARSIVSRSGLDSVSASSWPLV